VNVHPFVAPAAEYVQPPFIIKPNGHYARWVRGFDVDLIRGWSIRRPQIAARADGHLQD
jgi:hypothetical protein